MKRNVFGLFSFSAFMLLVICSGVLGQAPPEFVEVGEEAEEISFENILVAINCGTGTYEVREVTFHAWNDVSLDAVCTRAQCNLAAPSWNAAWAHLFTGADLEYLDDVYKSIAYWNQPQWVEFTGLNPDGMYTLQILFTANQTNTWDHGGSLRVTGVDDTIVASDFHLNTFAMGIPFVVIVEDIEPSAEGTIRLEYFREATWVPAPALDPNWIWQGITLSGPPIMFPTGLGVEKKGDVLEVSWTNHEPSTNGTPYDEIEILIDDEVRAVVGEGAAPIDEDTDNTYSFDLTDGANADLLEGAHIYQIKTWISGYSAVVSTVYGIAPVRVAVGEYGGPFAGLETSDGRIWSSDFVSVRGDRIVADWQLNVDLVVGVAGVETFGLDPMDPVDQMLFSNFLYDSGGGGGNYLEVAMPIPDGTYDVMLYFWEYASPWIYDRTVEIRVEGSEPTFAAYGDPEGIFAAAANEAWAVRFESVEVSDGEINVDLFPGWKANKDVTLSAFEILPADPQPKGPVDLQVETTGNYIYDLSWTLPDAADYTHLNILSRMSGQAEQLEDTAATSYVFEQEIFYESTNNEAFILQARNGNVFYPQLHAGAGVPPMYINAGGAGAAIFTTPNELPVQARGLTWVSDVSYVDGRFNFAAPVVSGDRNHADFIEQAFYVEEGSPADLLDPPFDTPENLAGDELKLVREVRWTWATPTRTPALMPMRWEVPINDGTYFVRIYFSEGHGQRATDVTAESSDPQRIYYDGLAVDDVFPEDIPYVAGMMGVVSVMEFEEVVVEDGFLTLAFTPFCLYMDPYDNNPTIAAIEVLPSEGPPPEGQFKRGDVNADDSVNIADAITILSHLFGGLPAPLCPDTADANDDGGLNIADAVSILSYLFGGADDLPPPFGECGLDETPDELGECDYPPCY